jgi:hypothetical protein
MDMPELTVLMPCLNEAETLATCIRKAQGFLEREGVRGEILVADNGSTDGSQAIARRLGARVVEVSVKGYGAALTGGIEAARGRYIIMGDSDDSYDFSALMPFLHALRAGADLVMGNRFRGGVAKGAMPPLHRYLGNPVLTGIGRLFFRSAVGDFHCGLRGFSKDAASRMGLRTSGMEFASEMVVKATLLCMRVEEVPTTLSKDGRSKPPHLRSWRDGWRHLRFLLMYSPRWLFLFPGIGLVVAGSLVTGWLLLGAARPDRLDSDVHVMLLASAAILVGAQSILFAVFTKTFGILQGLMPPDPRMSALWERISLETGLIVGAIMLIVGVGLGFMALLQWNTALEGEPNALVTLRLVIPSVTLLSLGAEAILSSFLLSILGLPRNQDAGGRPNAGSVASTPS